MKAAIFCFELTIAGVADLDAQVVTVTGTGHFMTVTQWGSLPPGIGVGTPFSFSVTYGPSTFTRTRPGTDGLPAPPNHAVFTAGPYVVTAGAVALRGNRHAVASPCGAYLDAMGGDEWRRDYHGRLSTEEFA
jgi:hypothetical protein